MSSKPLIPLSARMHQYVCLLRLGYSAKAAFALVTFGNPLRVSSSR